MRRGTTGAFRPGSTDPTLPGTTALFEGNRYRLGPGKHFNWGASLLNAKQWRAIGMDKTGTFARL